MKHVQELVRELASLGPQPLYRSLQDIGDDPTKSSIAKDLEGLLGPDTFALVCAVFQANTVYRRHSDSELSARFDKARITDCKDAGTHKTSRGSDFCGSCGYLINHKPQPPPMSPSVN